MANSNKSKQAQQLKFAKEAIRNSLLTHLEESTVNMLRDSIHHRMIEDLDFLHNMKSVFSDAKKNEEGQISVDDFMSRFPLLEIESTFDQRTDIANALSAAARSHSGSGSGGKSVDFAAFAEVVCDDDFITGGKEAKRPRQGRDGTVQ